MSLADAFRKIGFGKIRAVAGGVYVLKDSIIKIPDAELANNRTKHDFRLVIVLSNQNICNSVACPVITVVPLSSRLIPRAETDLVVQKSAVNGLDSDSRLMFGYVQPVLKSDLDQQIGVIDEQDWQQIMCKIVWNFDR